MGDRFTAIQELHKEGFPVSLLCALAGLARSSYYKWLKRSPSCEEERNLEILTAILSLHEKYEGIYGYRRMKLNINRLFNCTFNHKRIYRLMKVARIQAVIRRKRKAYLASPPQHVAENVLNREFLAEAPNEKWVTDVTEFKYGNGRKAYLSAIRDLYDGSIISYVIGHSNNNPLVFQTLDKALETKIDAHPILHSDRGFQYTSKQFKRKLDDAGITHSMSRVGRCIDNSPMESFWGSLKCEKYYLHSYSSFEELQNAIHDYIHFYNHHRLQEKLGGLSPIEYRAKTA